MSSKRALLAAAALVAAAATLAFLPAVQTWAVRKALAPRARVGRFSAGLGRLTVESLGLELDHAALSAPRVEAEMDVFSALVGRGWHLRSLAARGWTLDFTQGGAAPAERGLPQGSPLARSLGGVLSAFDLRADLLVDRVDLEGDVIVPDDAGRPSVRVHVVVTGGNLGGGRDGRLTCRAVAVSEEAGAPVTSVSVEGTVTATLENSGVLSRAEVKADATATGPDFPSGIGLSLAGIALRKGGGVSWSASLSREGERIAEIGADAGPGSQDLDGSWSLDLRDTDVAPFALGRRLPTFHAAGRGRYTLAVMAGDLHATGKLDVTADRLGRVGRSLESLGRIGLSADFDVAGAGNALRVIRLDAGLSGAGPALTLKALQSFEFDTSTGELKVADPTGDLVGISLKGLPVEWLQGLAPGFAFSGSPLTGEFVMRAEDGRLALRTRAPLSTAGLSVSHLGRPLVSGLELSAFVLADYASQGWQVQVAPLSLRRASTKILSLEARLGHLEGGGRTLKAAGSWSAALPALLEQPAAAGLPSLASGDATGSFEAVLDTTRSLKLMLQLSNLASSQRPDLSLPSVSAEARADFGAGGRVTYSVPVRLDYGSRLTTVGFSGEARPGPEGAELDGSVTTGRLTAGDVAVLLSLAGPRGRAVPATVAGVPGPAPAWPGIRGKITAKAEAIELPWASLDDVRAVLDVEPYTVGVSEGTTRIGPSSRASFSGRLNYLPSAREPYMARADVALEGLDAGAVFTTANPGTPPLVEGRFDVGGHLTAEGASGAELLARVQGDLTFTSKGGVFRALGTTIKPSFKQESSRLAGALDSVGALFGKRTEKLGTSLLTAVKDLSEIPYDRMSASVERGSDLDLRISELTLIAPEERLSGKGSLAHADGVPVRDQALSLDLDLAVRGPLERTMDIVGLLSEGQDDLGYTHVYQTVHLGGSLSHIDDSQWRETLIQAPLRKGGGLFDKLLGR